MRCTTTIVRVVPEVIWEAMYVEFRVDVGSGFGVLVDPGRDLDRAELLTHNVDFGNIELPIDGYTVSVSPFVGGNFWVDEWDERHEGLFLSSFDAVVSYGADLLREGRSFDNNLHYLKPRRCAQQALRRVLSHLRSTVPDSTAVDLNLSGFRFVEFLDEMFTSVDNPVSWNDMDVRPTLPDRGINEDSWAQIRHRAQADLAVPIGKNWLLDAKSFLVTNNANMALTAAAVACEVFAYELIVQELTRNDRVTATQATKFVDEVSNRVLLPTMLTYFNIGDSDLVAAVHDLFSDRNSIIHGKRKTPIAYKKAQTAVWAAESLEARLRA